MQLAGCYAEFGNGASFKVGVQVRVHGLGPLGSIGPTPSLGRQTALFSTCSMASRQVPSQSFPTSFCPNLESAFDVIERQAPILELLIAQQSLQFLEFYCITLEAAEEM